MRTHHNFYVPAIRRWRVIDVGMVRIVVLSIILACVTLTSATFLMSLREETLVMTTRAGAGSALRQGIYFSCVIATILASRPLTKPGRLIAFPPLLLALLGVSLISLFWSTAPSVGFRRLALTFIVIWLMFRIVNELGYRRAMSVMTLTLVGILIANYIAIALSPAAVHRGGGGEGGLAGNWRGILPHKNVAGPITAITILLLSFGIGRIKIVLRLLIIAAAAYFLYRTQSKTSISLVGLGLAAGILYLRYNPAYRVLLIPFLMIAGSVFTYAAVTQLPTILASLDSSEDAFTGRIQIWQTMIAFLQDHPWLGAGFGSFWDSGPISPANIYGRSWVAASVAEGHNGYLDTWTQLGIFGLILTVSVFFLVPFAKMLMAKNIPRMPGAATIGILVFMLGHNFTESSMLMRDFFGNLILAFTVACIENMVSSHPVRLLTFDPGSPQRVPASRQ